MTRFPRWTHGGQAVRRPPRKIEAEHQKALANWLKCKGLFFTISTGGVRVPMKTAVEMKAMGYRKGTSDVLIFEPRMPYHGLFIEMKTPSTPGICDKGGVKPEQREFMVEAGKRGYKAVVCYGSQEAMEEVEKYMEPVWAQQKAAV